ncbi:type III pantothenate kinase [candidate division WOR-3 bacterium]|uniref:Type III pantothenate kinase n=1 Tax=candidate division WOR-3 bacterium TaxID=2052148 RepID=A0A937XEJ8_UNCW3|nr:type III pantothenate kinase [candidate division WOR-3 bacterium]
MILTVLVGNTNTRLAWFNSRRLERFLILPTPALRDGRLPRPGPIAGIAVASVVAAVTNPVIERLRSSTGLEPLVVGPGTRTGLRFKYLRKDLGADRVCVAVGAARSLPGRDVIVFDFGTATTVNVILGEGVFAGGAILPGIQMSLDCLAAGTAGLPIVTPGRLLGPLQRTTRTAIQAGVSALFAGGIDRIVDQVELGLRRRFEVVATGGAASIARSYGRRIRSVRPRLANEGLGEIWYRNNCPRE